MVILEPVDKVRVARQFSRAARRYDDYAHVQERIAGDALERVSPDWGVTLDIGCGSGRVTRLLAQKCNHVYGVDLAEGMVLHASEHAHPRISWLTGDAESLPFAHSVFDNVFSSMALQWCAYMSPVFGELLRVMKPGGEAVLAIMSEGSMAELSESWKRLDHHPHVNQFRSANGLLHTALECGFQGRVESEVYVDKHADIRSLLNSIKGVGANVVNQTGNHITLRRNTLSRLEAVFTRKCSEPEWLPLTYVVSFLTLRKPQ